MLVGLASQLARSEATSWEVKPLRSANISVSVDPDAARTATDADTKASSSTMRFASLSADMEGSRHQRELADSG